MLTEDELGAMSGEPSYRTFVQGCLLSNTILFLGLSADDVAVGGHLERLAEQRVESGPHYWITSRRDMETDRWAERLGVRVIRYEAVGEDHRELLEALEDIGSYVPPEDSKILRPVVARVSPSGNGSLPAPEALASKDPEEIRWLINAYLKTLASKGLGVEDEYKRFRGEYDEAIYRSWYVTDQPGRNLLLGYRIESAAKRGAFGSVYRATSRDGDAVAVKVLLEEIRNDGDLILRNRHVDGVVTYLDSSEIPAFVVMNWVEGPSLEEAVDAVQLTEWDTLLRCAFELASVLKRAHELPERVLHRDLRPANIMLENFYTDDAWRVVVLDFDLSWHRGASDRSVTYGATVLGYLAPEQITRIKGVSTRHAAVDVFGLGMLLYFMAARRHPLPSEHRHEGWVDSIQAAARLVRAPAWRSIPARFARIVENATKDEQAQRWDLSQVHTELSRLREASVKPSSVSGLDMIAEEIASLTDSMEGYVWNNDDFSASASLVSGASVSLFGDPVSGSLKLVITWQDTGIHNFGKLRKWLLPASRSSEAILRSNGWDSGSKIELQSLRVEGTIRPKGVSTDSLQVLARSIDKALKPLREVR